MSNDPKWRQVEKIVALMESALDGTNAVITSPDKIPELSSGHLRDVDVTIKQRIGSQEVVIGIECRTHRRRQGTPWLEQLKGKRDNLGLAKIVAVSTSGFSKDGRDYASRNGIELCELDRVQTEDVRQWASMNCFSLVTHQIHIDEAILEVPSEYAASTAGALLGPAFLPKAMSWLSQPFATQTPGDEKISIENLLNNAVKSGNVPVTYVPTPPLKIRFIPPVGIAWEIHSESTRIPVTGLRCKVRVLHTVQQLGLGDLASFRYTSPSSTVHMVSGSFLSPTGPVKTSLLIDHLGKLSFSIQPEDSH